MMGYVSISKKILESQDLTFTEKGFLCCIWAGIKIDTETTAYQSLCESVKSKGYIIVDGKIFTSEANYKPQVRRKTDKLEDESGKQFEDFWKRIPAASKRGGKHRPLQIWRRLTDDERLIALKVVDAWRGFEEKKDDPSLVPHLSTWLNQKRWEAFNEALNDGNN